MEKCPLNSFFQPVHHEQPDYFGIIFLLLSLIIFPFLDSCRYPVAVAPLQAVELYQDTFIIVTHISCSLLIPVPTSVLIKFNMNFGLE